MAPYNIHINAWNRNRRHLFYELCSYAQMDLWIQHEILRIIMFFAKKIDIGLET
jgi:hypothetical protein